MRRSGSAAFPKRFGRKQVKPPARLVLADGDPLPGWLVLGEQRGTELAFGAVGKFWQGKIEWRDVPRDDFRDFAEAGFGKIAGARFAVAVRGCGGTRRGRTC